MLDPQEEYDSRILIRDFCLHAAGPENSKKIHQLNFAPDPEESSEEEEDLLDDMNFSRMKILSYDSISIANQLTILEAESFARMRHRELLRVRWQKNKAEAKQLIESVERFNRISYWVATTILQLDSPREEAAAFKHWLEVAKVRILNSFVFFCSLCLLDRDISLFLFF